MCNSCFQKEIEKFQSIEQYNDFYLQIEAKRKNNELLYLNHVDGYIGKPKWQMFGIGIGAVSYPDYDLYKCAFCNQLWMLSEPENAWRGFLKKYGDEQKI